jgi:hypothetical protein
MAQISDEDAAVGIEKLVVFEVSSYQHIGTGTDGIGQQKGS